MVWRDISLSGTPAAAGREIYGCNDTTDYFWTLRTNGQFLFLRTGLDRSWSATRLRPRAMAPGPAHGHARANLDKFKSINNIRRLMGKPYCISVEEKRRGIVVTPETTLSVRAAWLHPSRSDKFVFLCVLWRPNRGHPEFSQTQHSENQCQGWSDLTMD